MYQTKQAAIAALALAVAIPTFASTAHAEEKKETLVPLRTVAEAVGGSVAWHGETEAVQIEKGDKIVSVQIGSTSAVVNGQPVTLPQAPQLVDGRTVVPLSFLNQALHSYVRWDDKEQRISVAREVGDLSGFTPQTAANGSKGLYDIDLKMDANGTFTVSAKVVVENISADSWENVVFHMIPNAFTKENRPVHMQEAGTFQLNSVKVDGKTAAPTLQHDTLTVPASLKSGEQAEITLDYAFTVPKSGVRFAEIGGNYFLAQWHPMLATYQNGWVKHDFTTLGESYHTGHSDFRVTYHVPEGYTLFSTGEPDAAPNTTTGVLAAYRVKEFYLGIAKDVKSVSQTLDGIQVRVFARASEPEDAVKQALDVSTDALHYYNEKIGRYPYHQLDIVMDGSGYMEYPGLVTVGSPVQQGDRFEHVVAHEIAHQWFYATVSNDPYNEAWIDEGLTELLASLYQYDGQKELESEAFASINRFRPMTHPSNLPMLDYKAGGYGAAVYSQPGNRLWNELLKPYGGAAEAARFLNAYYNNYAFREVTTAEFVRFTKEYYPVDDAWFASWLKL